MVGWIMTPLFKQSWAVSAVLINMFAQGMILSFPTALLPALRSPHSSIKADLHTGSWLASMIGPAAIPGVLLSSFLMDLYGRKMSHIIMILPGVVGLLLTYFASNIPMLAIGRFLGGFTAAGTVSLGAIIIGEYSAPKHRGVFLYLKNAAVCMGATLVHTMSHFVHWRTIALITLIPNFIAIGINSTWLESPAWLVSKERYETSEAAFYQLRGRSKETSRELEQMIKAQMKRLSISKSKLTYKQKTLVFLNKFTRKDFIKPTIIMILATLVLEVSGRHIFPAYGVQIVSLLTADKSEIVYYTLAIDLIILSSALFSSYLVKVMKRRALLFYTGFAAFAVLMIVCGYLLLVSQGVIANSSSLLSTSLFAVYFILANLGCAPIPLALVGEVFPLAHRGAGMAVTGVWISIFLMSAMKATPHLLASIHIYGTFAVYGVIMFVCLLILYFIIPETKDRTLQEIENYFNYGKFENDELNDDDVNTKMIDKGGKDFFKV